MYNFFVNADNKKENRYFIVGDDYNHIKNVLRMKLGDEILVSDAGVSHLCAIEDISEDLEVLEIFCGHKVEIELIVKGQGICNVHINGIAVNTRFGIGIPI